MTINISHIYPELLNLYGDRGNIATLKRRLNLRNIECVITNCSPDDEIDFENTDIILLGGGGEREQKKALDALMPQKDKLLNYIEGGGCMLAICGGFEMLLKDGLGILDISCDAAKKRIADDIVIKSDITGSTIVGFENHAKNIYIGDYTPLGTVEYGIGNSIDAKGEGVIYKNLICTNMYGPLLPKNPQLADYLIKCALSRKYTDEFSGELKVLSDELETKAHEYIVKRCEKQGK